MEGWLIFIGVIAAIWLIGWLSSRVSNFRQRKEKRREIIDDINSLVKEKTEAVDILVKERTQAVDILIKEKTQGFPWLVNAYDDYYKLQDLKLANMLETKSHPAYKSAELVRQISKERREAEKAARLSKYLLDYSKYLAPWLDDYINIDFSELDAIISEIHSSWEKKEREFDEETRQHFGPKYDELDQTQKLQKKLEWYWDKPDKSDWQIGRDYERYIGYLYEMKGWKVYYHGKKGFEDLGRDLICKKDNKIEIVQCKRWAQSKTIHEKHIYYLFGTTVEYYLENSEGKNNKQLVLLPDLIRHKNVIPRMVVTTQTSDVANKVANLLGVEINVVQFPKGIPPYPSVKCNIARRTGEKIYHLPFDQQYDTALIEEERNERHVNTVFEAEDLGFRHAYRWKGDNEGEANL